MQTTERSSDRAHQDLTTTKNSGEQKKNNRTKFDRKPTVSTKSKEEKKIPKSQFFKKKSQCISLLSIVYTSELVQIPYEK